MNDASPLCAEGQTDAASLLSSEEDNLRLAQFAQHAGELSGASWILGDGVDQAADISWFATSIPSRNFTPRTIFGN